MRNRTNRVIGCIFLLVMCGSAHAQNGTITNVITTAVPFLRISPDAHAGGMGDVGVATTPDANSGYWNVAKAPFATEKGALVANYSPWLKNMANDMYLANLAGYYKVNDGQAVTGSMTYFNMGSLQFEDNNGNHLQTFSPREFGLNAGYSMKLSGKSSIGLGVKYIYSNLATNGTGGNDYKTGNAFAVDIGYYYNGTEATGSGWSFGAAASNLGTKISYSTEANQGNYLPANLGIGAAYTLKVDDDNKLLFALDVNKLLVPTPPAMNDSAALAAYQNKSVASSWFNSFSGSNQLKELQLSAGAEYWYDNLFAVRAGYFYEDKSQGDRRYFTAGVSLSYSTFTLHFSYLVPSGGGITTDPLANTLRFGVVLKMK